MQKPQDTWPMAVAGQFYPDDPQELRTQLKEFFRAYSSDPDGRNVRASSSRMPVMSFPGGRGFSLRLSPGFRPV